MFQHGILIRILILNITSNFTTLNRISYQTFHLLILLPTPGAVNATDCPRGTIRNAISGAALVDCYPCPAGHYCADPGLFTPTGVCDAGYYCPDFAEIKDPMPTTYPCPAGYYCMAKTGVPDACPPGEW